MEVSEAVAARQANIALRYDVAVTKGALEQQEQVVMTLLESTGQSAPKPDGRGSLLNVIA